MVYIVSKLMYFKVSKFNVFRYLKYFNTAFNKYNIILTNIRLRITL